MTGLRFDGKSGSKPQAEARRYVYRIIAAMLDNADERRWFFDGLDEDPDRRRVNKAIRAVSSELLRKALR